MITIIFWIQHPVVARSFCCFVLYQFLSSFSFCCYPKHEDAPSYCSVCFYFNKCIEVYCCVWLSMVGFFGPPASMFVGRGRRCHQWKVKFFFFMLLPFLNRHSLTWEHSLLPCRHCQGYHCSQHHGWLGTHMLRKRGSSTMRCSVNVQWV